MSVFKTVEESIELFKQGVPCDTGFEYVYNAEEVDFGDGKYEFDVDGDVKAQLDEIRRDYEENLQVVSEGQEPFAEFTFTICPAYKA